MARLRFDNVSSFGAANPITIPSGAGTCTWVSAPSFPTIVAPDYAVIVSEPDTANEQRRYLTAYTSGATSGTISAAQEGSTGAARTAVEWQHGPTALDFLLGQIPQTPVLLAPVDFVTTSALSPDYTYNNGSSGIGATLTGNSNGALSVDGTAVSIGQRIAVTGMALAAPSPTPDPSLGIYVVTTVGDGSNAYVLTRTTDCDTPAVLGSFWATICGDLGTNTDLLVYSQPFTGTPPTFDIGTDSLAIGAFALAWEGEQPSIAIGPGAFALNSGIAAGPNAIAVTDNDTAVGVFSSATGGNSTAIGTDATATASGSTAIGQGATAQGNDSVALGQDAEAEAQGASALVPQSTAVRTNSTVVAFHGVAYDDGQDILATGPDDNNEQFSITIGAITTSDATPTPTINADGNARLIRFVDSNGTPDFTKTMIARVRVIARRTDTVGTDSAWSTQGVLRGDGSAAYTWIGGSAPTFTLIAQDAGASTWAVTIAIGTDPEDSVANDALIVTVTGQAAKDISWEATLELDEVSAA